MKMRNLVAGLDLPDGRVVADTEVAGTVPAANLAAVSVKTEPTEQATEHLDLLRNGNSPSLLKYIIGDVCSRSVGRLKWQML